MPDTTVETTVTPVFHTVVKVRIGLKKFRCETITFFLQKFKQITSIQSVLNWYKTSGYTVYLLVNFILKITLHLQLFYRQLEDQQVAPLK